MLEIGELLKEGKSKRIYATNDPEAAVIYFKDEALAYHGLKRGRILGKGEVNNQVCKHIFTLLEEHGVKTHFVRQLDERQSVVKRLEMIPLGVKVRNLCAGSLTERVGLPVGTRLDPPVCEVTLKDDELDNPLINLSHVRALGIATAEEFYHIRATALEVNRILSAYMQKIGIELIDFKLEFGRYHGEILVADEITPDTARFWDMRTHECLDIDCFRRDLGDAEQAYQEVLHRMMGEDR